MKFTARLKKRLLLLFLIPMFLLAAALGVFWFFIHYRFKDSIKYLVAKESKGRYVFDASDASISFWKGTIVVKGSQLYCRDTTGVDAWCNMQTPELYFSLASWKTLLFDKKLIVDSLAIIGPSIHVHVRNKMVTASHNEFHAADFVSLLQKTLLHLNIRAFALKDASFTYEGPAGSEPLHGGHINLAVANFAKLDNGDSHLLASDNVSLSLGRQHWVITGGRQEIDFARLTFDSRGQRFQLDSFSFRQKKDTGEGEFRLSADRFFFNSSRLPAVYQEKGLLKLLLDTLVCINPVLSIPEPLKQSGASDTTMQEKLFGWINVRFVDVINGYVLVRNKAGHPGNASTRKADLSIYNLQFDPSKPSLLTTDSIRLKLRNIEFLTPDSLYMLSIGEFAILGNDALFSQVKYAPIHPDPGKEVVFTAPSLLLRDISIPDLLLKHIKASGAQLLQPSIMMSDNKPPDTTETRRQTNADAKKIALFYRTLHNVRALIDAPTFNIIDGNAHYTHTGSSPIQMDITGLNAHLLLNKFFISDSLVDIKHAIPDWRIGTLSLTSRGLHLLAEQYSFDGTGKQHSSGGKFSLRTDSGLQLEGKNIFWHSLDWDRFQKTKEIQIDSLHLDQLTLHAPASFGTIQLSANDLHLTGIRSTAHALTWEHAQILLHDIGLQTRQANATIQSLAFNSDSGATARGIHLDLSGNDNSASLSIPAIFVDAQLHSTDLTSLMIQSLSSPDASLSYSKKIKKDSLLITARVKLTAGPLTLSPLKFSTLDISCKNTALNYRTDSTALQVRSLAGALHAAAFVLPAKGNSDWRPWLDMITVSRGAVHYSTRKLTADAADFSWDNRSLRIADFSIAPIMTREESFKQARWQQDYITLKGKALILSKLRLAGDPHHLSPEIQKLELNAVVVEASRDKHIPFHHGIEKAMPTKLLGTIPFAIRVDTVLLVNDKVIYNELSLATNRWSTIPIEQIDGYVTHLKSRDNAADTLKVDASGRIFDGHIRRFAYRESYGDPLSSFTAASNFSSLDLTRLSSVSIPAAAVSVTGHVDTVWSVWQGNRYAAYGTMDLYYDRLRVRVLDKKDSMKRGVVPTLETWAARVLLPAKNKSSSAIFFERDQEKFVFNYWVKAQGSGILSTLVRKKNSQYRKLYEEKYRLYSLPPEGKNLYSQ